MADLWSSILTPFQMEKLLLTPPVEMVYATSTDGGEGLKASNGAYLGRPFTEYIN